MVELNLGPDILKYLQKNAWHIFNLSCIVILYIANSFFFLMEWMWTNYNSRIKIMKCKHSDYIPCKI